MTGVTVITPSIDLVKELPWDNGKLVQGDTAKLKACALKVKWFRLMVYPNRTDYVIKITRQYIQLKTPQKHVNSDGRLNNTTMKLSKLQALLNAKLAMLKLSVNILLPLYYLGSLSTHKHLLEV